MSLTGLNHFISLNDAIAMTSLFRAEKDAIIDSTYRNEGLLLQCETFDRGAFDALLAQDGCEGIRIYFSMHTSLKVRAIFVGVDRDNKDMLPGDSFSPDYKIVEAGAPCPDMCPPTSPLNSD
jgi:hypothetical protein